MLQIIRTYILTQGDHSFSSKIINNQGGRTDVYVKITTPALLPQPALSSPPFDGALVWKDHPKVTLLDGRTEFAFAKLLLGHGI